MNGVAFVGNGKENEGERKKMTQAYVGLAENLFGQGGEFNKTNYINGFCDGMLDNWT